MDNKLSKIRGTQRGRIVTKQPKNVKKTGFDQVKDLA